MCQESGWRKRERDQRGIENNRYIEVVGGSKYVADSVGRGGMFAGVGGSRERRQRVR